MATYREELSDLSARVVNARVVIKEQIIALLNKQIQRAIALCIPDFKRSIEEQLNADPAISQVRYTFCIGDEVFDPIDLKEKDLELRLEAFTSAVIAEMKALGWEDFRISARMERARFIPRLIGVRTYYAVKVALPITMSESDMKLLAGFGLDSMIAASKFIDRIKTGVLKPTEEPGAHFRRLAAEEGITAKQAAEDVEQVHTGQPPEYIKIDRKGANEHGNETTRKR